jgi:hypothetical protein
VETNLEKTLSSCEPISGLVVSQILCANENTNDEVVLNLNVAQARIEELQQYIRIEIF